MKISLTINSKKITAESGLTILQIAKDNGFRLLTSAEYFKLLDEAVKVKDVSMTASLRNKSFLEFLDTTNHGIANYVKAEPGLMLTRDIDQTTGLPRVVYPPNRYGDDDYWRYWSFPSDGREYCLVRSHIFLLGASCLDGKVGLNERFHNVGMRVVGDKIDAPKITFTTRKNRVTIDFNNSL